jgi:hypothetical protein
MQRIGLLLVGLIVVANASGAQQAAGTALWRVAATTLPVPPALAAGAAATFWNPAQNDDSGKIQVAFEAIQTPSAVGASGLLAAALFPTRALGGGHLGLVYGRVGLSDLTRTTDSPDPTGSSIPVYTFALGATWAAMLRGTNVGATLAFHETRLDGDHAHRWTMDVGARRTLAGGRLRIAAATHFFSSFSANDPAQDFYAGIEGRLWEGPLWGGGGGVGGGVGGVGGDRVTIRARYGLAFAHGFNADHHVSLGAEFSRTVALDIAVVREGSYSEGGWRPVAGLGITIGKYRVLLARDAGVNELGSAYRVGVDARFK